jgi:hypothetical protein
MVAFLFVSTTVLRHREHSGKYPNIAVEEAKRVIKAQLGDPQIEFCNYDSAAVHEIGGSYGISGFES